MNNTAAVLVATLAVFVFGSEVQAQAQAQDLEAQFARFQSWWPGTYENQSQAAATPASFTPLRLYLQPLNLPAFGSAVVYGEWQDMDAGLKVVRQRFYSFEIDAARQALRLNLHIFPQSQELRERTRGAYREPAKVAHLTPADMFPLPGCDVYFTWQGDHFAGAMDKGSCAFKAPGTNDDIYSWSQMRLTRSSFEYLDGWFNPDGSVYRVLADDWYIFQRQEQVPDGSDLRPVDETTAREKDIQRELNEAVARMMKIWPGQYENSTQMATDRLRGFTSWHDGGHAHVHSTVVAVDVPRLGAHLLYVEDYLDGDEKNIFRQKLYELTADVARAAVVVTLHSFHEPASVRGAHREPSLLSGLTREDLKNRPGCEMYFRPLGNGYSGAFDYGACTTDTGMVADNRMFIAPGHYWFSDQFRPADAPRPNAAIGQNWHRLLRLGS